MADGSGGHAFAENLQQHQQNVAKLRQFEQQTRQTSAPPDRALGYSEPPAQPVADPVPAAPAPRRAAKNTKQQKTKTKAQAQ